jgi:hypothetical protein
MKTLIRILPLLLAVSFTLAMLPPAEYTYGQCQAIAKSTGKRCKHGVSTPGEIYCWQHKK